MSGENSSAGRFGLPGRRRRSLSTVSDDDTRSGLPARPGSLSRAGERDRLSHPEQWR